MAKTDDELRKLLDRLIAGWESEVVEFKEANDNFSTSEIGKYFSALSNEANLKAADAGWLIFGVRDSTRTVVGSNFRRDSERLHGLKKQIADSAGASFLNVYELEHPDGRVVLFEIPPAPLGLPIGWNGHYYAREGEHLHSLTDSKRDQIRNQMIDVDWTAAIVPNATVEHLDPAAIARARLGFTERNASRIPAEDIAAWDDEIFLAKARLLRDGKITRAALLLLGSDTSTHLLTPHPAQVTWKLVGEQQANEHFRLPLLLNATRLKDRIRNVQLRLMPPNELIYREISKYDDRSLLEAVYNCIAHQDYAANSRIIVTEHPDRIVFESVGEFYDGEPDDYALDERTPRRYRNPFLVEAMAELNLIDQMGYGIHRMVQDQLRRFLPLPDYDLSNPREVKLTIPGAVIDEAYSQLLMVRTDLSPEDVLALDRVQKGLDISDKSARHLRRLGLIEGRKPRRRISPRVAAVAGGMADYIRTRPQADSHYAALLLDFLRAQGHADRSDIEALLLPALSDALTEQQKANKITNLLTKLRRAGQIVNRGSRARPRWELSYGGDGGGHLSQSHVKKSGDSGGG